jgi:hypothetical protein
MIDTSRSTPEADLAFLKAIVQGGNNPKATLTLGVAYLAGGLLYGLQCLFHIGQAVGWIGEHTRLMEVLLQQLAVQLGHAVELFTFVNESQKDVMYLLADVGTQAQELSVDTMQYSF